MLVVSRREGESVRIGPNVRVTIVALSPTQVRIGVEAPDDVFVHREEVFRRIEHANQEAARAAGEFEPAAGREGDA